MVGSRHKEEEGEENVEGAQTAEENEAAQERTAGTKMQCWFQNGWRGDKTTTQSETHTQWDEVV